METVGIKQLAEEVGLEPKLVRRIIRKNVKRGTGESGKYTLSPESEFYLRVKGACEAFKSQQEKKVERRPKESSTPRVHSDDVKMDDRGFSIIDGKVWAMAIYGKPDKSGAREIGQICLGRKEDVLPYIEGRTHMKPTYDDPACTEALRTIMTGESAIPLTSGTKSTGKSRVIKRRQRRGKR